MVLEGVGGGGGSDGIGQLHSEFTVHCEQQNYSYTTELQINSSVKRCESQLQLLEIRGRFTKQLDWTADPFEQRRKGPQLVT